MTKRLLSSDPLTGINTYFQYDPLSKKVLLSSVQDCTDIIEQNKRRQTDGSNGWSKTREFKHVATVSNLMLVEWAREAGVPVNDPAMGEIVKKRLNDPDFAAFRTGMGRI